MEERNAERHAFSPRRLKALITAVRGSCRAAWKLAAFGAGTGRQPLTVRPFVRSSRTGNSGNIIPIGGRGVKNPNSQKAFPFGEGGFFIALWAMKKTEEVLPQDGFAEG